MRTVFADSWFWIALANPADQDNPIARGIITRLGRIRIVTTQEVLTEFLNYCRVPGVRSVAAQMVRRILSAADTYVIEQTSGSFLDGLELFEDRDDKSWSLTDCISMRAMHEEGLEEVLTADQHFTQAGFTVLGR